MLATRVLMFGLAAAVVFGVRASGATIDVDTILGPDHPYLNETITVVDGLDPPTLVQVLEGARIGGLPGQQAVPIGMDVYDQSVIEVVDGTLLGRDQAVLLHDRASLTMFNGEVRNGGVELRDTSRAYFHGGRFGAFRGLGVSHIEVYGGEGSGRVYENARINQSGGNLTVVELHDQSSFVMQGGFLDESFQTFGDSRALINGGSIGGEVDMFLNEQSIVTVRGGGLSGQIQLNDEALLHVYGFGLEFFFDEDLGSYYVQGNLADGAEAHLEYRLADQDQIILHEVPEPATWGMLAIGVAGITAAGWSRARATKLRR